MFRNAKWIEVRTEVPIVCFGDGVKFYVVEAVTQLFNDRGLKFYLATFEDKFTGIKTDLYESNSIKIEEKSIGIGLPIAEESSLITARKGKL